MTQSLIERLQAASGPDRELDGAIARWLGLEVQLATIGPDHRRKELIWIERPAPDRAPISRPVPRYTTSTDAALTLMPEGYRYSCGTWEEYPLASATMSEPTSMSPHYYGYSATTALAICIAALKARATP